jgi:hypothetical protein
MAPIPTAIPTTYAKHTSLDSGQIPPRRFKVKWRHERKTVDRFRARKNPFARCRDAIRAERHCQPHVIPLRQFPHRFIWIFRGAGAHGTHLHAARDDSNPLGRMRVFARRKSASAQNQRSTLHAAKSAARREGHQTIFHDPDLVASNRKDRARAHIEPCLTH